MPLRISHPPHTYLRTPHLASLRFDLPPSQDASTCTEEPSTDSSPSESSQLGLPPEPSIFLDLHPDFQRLSLQSALRELTKQSAASLSDVRVALTALMSQQFPPLQQALPASVVDLAVQYVTSLP